MLFKCNLIKAKEVQLQKYNCTGELWYNLAQVFTVTRQQRAAQIYLVIVYGSIWEDEIILGSDGYKHNPAVSACDFFMALFHWP